MGKRRQGGMRGIGGPLLTIGDLLSDVGEENVRAPHNTTNNPSGSGSVEAASNHPLDLSKLFQGNYDQLNEALASSDHSWTPLTLKLCNALETANKLVRSTNTNVTLLSEKVGELEQVVRRGDSAIAAAKAIHVSLHQKQGPLLGSQGVEQSKSH